MTVAAPVPNPPPYQALMRFARWVRGAGVPGVVMARVGPAAAGGYDEAVVYVDRTAAATLRVLPAEIDGYPVRVELVDVETE